ncbi:hypothetical protein DRQ33_02080, partial [bacterium]
MRILDKYISTKFWRFFILGILAFVVVFIVVDLVENIDNYIDKNAHPIDVVKYYLFFLPYIIALVTPIGTLLATAFLGGYMVKRRELVALRSAGISTLRSTFSLLIWGLVITVAIFIMGEFVLPTTNSLRESIKDEKIYKTSSHSGRLLKDLFYITEDGAIFYFRIFDIKSKLGRDVIILKKGKDGDISERIDAKRMKWNGTRWVLTDVIERKFTADGEKTWQIAQMEMDISESPEDFARKMPKPDEMGFIELSKFIDKIERSGIEPIREKTDLWMKFSYPLVNLIVIMLGVPIAFRQRKGSYIYGFGQSFFIAFLYLAALRAGQAFGYNGTLPPWLAAFAGDIIFASVGIVLLY